MTEAKFKLNDGKESSLADYKGKVVLVVNVASKCGLTPQYEGLEKMYEKYKDKGFTVIGFPANEFGAQEPGTNEEIIEFCKKNYGVTFPIAQKIVVKGEGQHPLYKMMTEDKPKAIRKEGGNLMERLISKGMFRQGTNEIMWNFEKFVFDKEGKLVERFAPDVTPEEVALVNTIETELAKK